MYVGLDIGGTKCAAVLGNLAKEVEILDKITLEECEKVTCNSIVLIACKVEGVRLIDNILLG